MCWHSSFGIVRAAASETAPGTYWLYVECCRELGRYYRYLCAKARPAYREVFEPQIWRSHITFGKKLVCDPKTLDGIAVPFEYLGEVGTNGKHFWLPARSPMVGDIRVILGEPRETPFPLHVTIGVLPGDPGSFAQKKGFSEFGM